MRICRKHEIKNDKNRSEREEKGEKQAAELSEENKMLLYPLCGIIAYKRAG